MPVRVEQELKAESTKKLQIKDADRGVVQKLIRLDACGWKPARMAEEVGLSSSRISIIIHSPRFLEAKQEFMAKVNESVVDKESTKNVEGDYVTQKIKDLAKTAIDTKAELLDCGMPAVQNAAASDILDRAGYGARKEVRTTTITMSEKVAERISKVMGYDEFAKHERDGQTKITQEVSA